MLFNRQMEHIETIKATLKSKKNVDNKDKKIKKNKITNIILYEYDEYEHGSDYWDRMNGLTEYDY